MQATTVEVLSMLGSWFSGLGAILAVLYAIKVNQPQVGARISDIEYYGDCGFTIDIFNNKSVNAHISYIRLVEKRHFNIGHDLPSKFSHYGVLDNSDKRQCERINIVVEPGAHMQFKFSASKLLNAYCELQDIQQVTSMTRMIRAQIAIHLTNGNVTYVELPRSQYQKMKNVLFKAACNRIDSAIELGNRYFPNGYSFKHIQQQQTRILNDYEYAYKRQMYLQQPKGISTDDFWNNK